MRRSRVDHQLIPEELASVLGDANSGPTAIATPEYCLRTCRHAEGRCLAVAMAGSTLLEVVVGEPHRLGVLGNIPYRCIRKPIDVSCSNFHRDLDLGAEQPGQV
jgi:hypothetical protein